MSNPSPLGPYGDLFTSTTDAEHEAKVKAWSEMSQAERDFVLGTKLNHVSHQLAVVQGGLNILGEVLMPQDAEDAPAPAEPEPAPAEAARQAPAPTLRLPRPSDEQPVVTPSPAPAAPLPVV